MTHEPALPTGPGWHGTTIVAVRKGSKVVVAGDGQVSVGNTVMKHNARKVRPLAGGKVIGGFAGSTADAFTLFERLEAKLERHPGQLLRAAIELAKLARLLPAVVLGPLTRDPGNKRRDWSREQDLVYVDAADVSAYEDTASRTLQQVAQAHVPLEGAENARILAWRPSDGGKEHLAIVVGEIDPTEPVLIRLHSECFTGDLLGSLRCDCGVQLRGAIAPGPGMHLGERQAQAG